jgi:aminopeptidase N
MLGDSLFRKCLHAYIDRWHGKHPIPWDFFHTFSNVSGRNLDWFWNSWFFSHGYDDLGIAAVKKRGTRYAVTVKNPGGFAIPFRLIAAYGDGTTDTARLTAEVWKKDLKETQVEVKTKKKLLSLTLDNGIWMDANEADNTWNQAEK